MTNTLMLMGLVVAAGTIAAMLWSIFAPMRRVWPPSRNVVAALGNVILKSRASS